MTQADTSERFVTLDILRGVAVLGILAVNILAFALPSVAAGNPHALGPASPADLASWFATFVLIEGKMRGLFSLLFGASMMLVIDRAEAAGRPGGRTHFARMAWLLAFGFVHHYFIWSGDILILYAAIGFVAFAFTEADTRAQLILALLLLAAQCFYFALLTFSTIQVAAAAAAPGAPADALTLWQQVSSGLTPYSTAQVDAVVARHQGSWGEMVAYAFSRKLWDPLNEIHLFGMETLAYFLLGMAALRSGFLTGAWSDRAYRRVTLVGFGIAIPIEIALAWALFQADFSAPAILLFSLTATVPVRPLMIGAIAAMVILATRRGGALTARIGAAGRTAFTNYVGTSIVMTGIFFGWGFGLFGRFSRAELWVFVALGWALMLVWPKPWLERFRYGPFEWAWRSLARGRREPLRRA